MGPVKTCKADASTCLTAEKLRQVQRVELMAEGVAGKVHLEVKSISAAPAQGATVFRCEEPVTYYSMQVEFRYTGSVSFFLRTQCSTSCVVTVLTRASYALGFRDGGLKKERHDEAKQGKN